MTLKFISAAFNNNPVDATKAFDAHMQERLHQYVDGATKSVAEDLFSSEVDEENLDELSKELLLRYRIKAGDNLDNGIAKESKLRNSLKNVKSERTKRLNGLHNASHKVLTKEEVIDEAYKVGDRVATSSYGTPVKATVTRIGEHGTIFIKHDGSKNERFAHPESIKRIKEEAIDELSKETIDRYEVANLKDQIKTSNHANGRSARWQPDARSKDYKRIIKREAGHRAVLRRGKTNEEVIDEISKGLAGRYINKASGDMHRIGQDVHQQRRDLRDLHDIEFGGYGVPYKDRISARDGRKEVESDVRKSNRRGSNHAAGIGRAVKRIQKEDVIDEVQAPNARPDRAMAALNPIEKHQLFAAPNSMFDPDMKQAPKRLADASRLPTADQAKADKLERDVKAVQPKPKAAGGMSADWKANVKGADTSNALPDDEDRNYPIFSMVGGTNV